MTAVQTRFPFSRAFIFSCIIHLVILGLLSRAGLWTANKAQPEPYLELELISDTAALQPVSPNLPALPLPAAPVSAGGEKADRELTRPSSLGSQTGNILTDSASFQAASGESGGGGGANTAARSANATAPSGKVSAPRILKKMEPAYPEEVRRRGGAGLVLMRIEVLENGHPGNIAIQQSSSCPALDEAATQAVRQWQFIPARDEQTGLAVRCYTTLSVVFRLE